ncbi:MAG: hypothetical protein RL595_3039 [Planctomycetota bacterium]
MHSIGVKLVLLKGKIGRFDDYLKISMSLFGLAMFVMLPRISKSPFWSAWAKILPDLTHMSPFFLEGFANHPLHWAFSFVGLDQGVYTR